MIGIPPAAAAALDRTPAAGMTAFAASFALFTTGLPIVKGMPLAAAAAAAALPCYTSAVSDQPMRLYVRPSKATLRWR